MLQPRFIPVLLFQGNGLVKTVKFKSPVYIGDPVNAVKIFNDKGADELLILNLDASENGHPMEAERLQEIATEAFMPVGYGGGIRTLQHIEQVIKCGVEKAVINTHVVNDPRFITTAAKEFGSSTLCVSVDYRSTLLGAMRVCSSRGSVTIKQTPVDFCKQMYDAGAGEIILHNVDRDGAMKGYDLKTLDAVNKIVGIPVVVCGGASSYNDLISAVEHGASGAAAGSLFVYSGPHKAVMINYPDDRQRSKVLAG